jgi:tRNA pseudouridine55 synthase
MPSPAAMESRPADSGGLLLVDKPAGITSHDVVAIVRRATHTRRVGHAGTLDPFATGLLVILTGRATRLIPYVDGEPKVYEATIRLGVETTTDDGTGETVRTADAPPEHAIVDAIGQLTGPLDQIPPAYSAKQIDGTRAYAAARQGAALDLPPSRVTVHEWSVLGRDGDDLRVRIACSGGTYIRALARDLGRLTGSAAHLSALRRTNSGPFSVESAMTIDALCAETVALRSLRAAIPSMPVQTLDAAELERVAHGNSIDARVDGARIALLDDEETLIAVADRAGERLHPKLVLRDG